MLRTHKYRLYPTPAQAASLASYMDAACDLYNAALQTVNDPFARNRGHRYKFWDSDKGEWVWRDARPPVYGQNPTTWGSELTEFRQQFPQLLPEGMPALVQHEVLARVMRTRAAMFKRAAEGKKAGTPRFRSRRRYDSITFGLTAPSRPPKERSEEWIVEHGPDLVVCIEHVREWRASGQDYAKVTAKDIQQLVNKKDAGAILRKETVQLTLDAARFLRVLTFESLGLPVPVGVTAGVGYLSDTALHLTGLGPFPILHRPRRRGAAQQRRVAGMRQHRPIPQDGIPRSAIVSRSCGRWYVCIAIEVPDPEPVPNHRAECGTDLGVMTWMTVYSDDGAAIAAVDRDLGRQQPAISHLRDGSVVKIDGAGASEKHAKRVRKWQRTVSRRTKRGHAHSHRRQKAVAQYARAKEAERNLRADHRHKVTRVLASRFSRIGMEDLGVREMTQAPRNELERDDRPARLKEKLNRRILDQAWYTVRLWATYKAEEAGGSVVTVPAAHTTDTCSECGTRVPMPPLMRWFKCPSCGFAAPRTTNSARNVFLRMRAGVKQERPGGAHPSGHNHPKGGGLRTNLPLPQPSGKPSGSTSRSRKKGGV